MTSRPRKSDLANLKASQNKAKISKFIDFGSACWSFTFPHHLQHCTRHPINGHFPCTLKVTDTKSKEMLENRYVTFIKERAVLGFFHITRHLLCFQAITGLQVMGGELVDGNEYPATCCVDASIQRKAWHCNTCYLHVQLFHLIII